MSATENGDFGAVLTMSQAKHTARVLAVYASPSSYLLRRNTRFRVTLGLTRAGVESAGLQEKFLYLFMVFPSSQAWPGARRGRDTHCWVPPAQIRTCGIPASGSSHQRFASRCCLGAFGVGFHFGGRGSLCRRNIFRIRFQLMPPFWERRLSHLRQIPRTIHM